MSGKIRALVADDEPIARDRVVSLLAGEPDVEVVSQCATGSEARAAIEQSRLDLLFLDIQMPEMSGLDLARAIQANGEPAVVFVTAHDQYALPAFEVHALDYLLKPFSAERFRAALGHAREHLARRRAGGGPIGLTSGGAASAVAAHEPRKRLMVKSGGRIHLVRTVDIDWCEAAGNYVRMHAGPHEYLVRETMAHLESQLDRQQFMRIHRSTIVNVDRIVEMQSSFNGEYVVQLRNGTRLTLSRGYRDAIQARLGKPL
ncbi:MAG: response regulator transcription factor [Acidobacteria bacterium]|nr:response regulator transcription factor [Acidobacteriota bacterium]